MGGGGSMQRLNLNQPFLTSFIKSGNMHQISLKRTTEFSVITFNMFCISCCNVLYVNGLVSHTNCDTNWNYWHCPSHPVSQLIPGTLLAQTLSFTQSPPSQSVPLDPCHPNLPLQSNLLCPPRLLQEVSLHVSPLLLLQAAQWSCLKEEQHITASQRRLQAR